mmetsp:Transcript_11232/g.27008  ORF Transcript_11232/g.27008 Transcript_11232/m.27008 type:complete len:452 (+) Transcript_11232:170-1525(+)
MPLKYSRQVEKDGTIMAFNQQMHDLSASSSRRSGGLNLPPFVQEGGGTVASRSALSSSARISLSSPTGGLNLPPPSFGGTAGARSVASTSTVPPPPVATTLERAGYLRPAPGALRFSANMESNDDGTIIIGDGSVQSSTAIARPVQSSSSQGPITAAIVTIPETAHEVPSAQVHRVHSAQHATTRKPTVMAEPMGDEEKPKPFWKDVKTMCCILFLVLLAIGLGVGFAIGLNNTSDDSSVAANSQVITNPPTQVAISAAPSPSPTLEFSPPNIATCETVSEGMDVDGQESMTVRRFTLDLDVTVVDYVQDISIFLEFIQSGLLQQEIAPEIAQCHEYRRKLERSRSLLERFVVGNAIFETVVLGNSVCASVTTENCFPIISTLVIYLKDDESDAALIGHVLDVFSKGWEFGLPFKSIQVTGARLYTTGDISGPTAAPSHEEEHESEYENTP